MKLPRGRLERQRVVSDLATPLASALETGLTGYARLESQAELLLSSAGVGVLTFDRGAPVVAYHTGTDVGGPAALADIAVTGPYRVQLFTLDVETLAPVHDADDLRVPPGMPAERLAGDKRLADRTRAAAPERVTAAAESAMGSADEPGAVEAFLEDDEKIEAIRARAREEAERRAAEWGFDAVGDAARASGADVAPTDEGTGETTDEKTSTTNDGETGATSDAGVDERDAVSRFGRDESDPTR